MPPTPLENALAAFYDTLVAAANAGQLAGHAAANIWKQPPTSLPVGGLPAIISLAAEGVWNDSDSNPSVVSSHQRQEDTIDVLVFAVAEDLATASRQLLPYVDALRLVVNGHCTLGGVLRNARPVRWKRGPIQWGDAQYFGLTFTCTFEYDLPAAYAA